MDNLLNLTMCSLPIDTVQLILIFGINMEEEIISKRVKCQEFISWLIQVK